MPLYGVTKPQYVYAMASQIIDNSADCLAKNQPPRFLSLCEAIAQVAITKGQHYIDVIMTKMASQITSLAVVYSIVYSVADKRKHQSSASLAFERGIHGDRWIPHTNGQ